MFQGSLFPTPSRDLAVRVGPAGWLYKDWEGRVYPPGAGARFDPLAFLADYFDTVEINVSFYRPPRVEDAADWCRRVRNNPRFKFTAKVWRNLTHQRSAATFERDCDEVRRGTGVIAEAGLLGALLLQFPISFRDSEANREYLEKLFRALAGYPLALEVRHESWNDEGFYTFLAEQNIAVCNIDQPVLGKALRPSARATASVGYLRLHGRNYGNWFRPGAGRDARYDYLYTKQEVVEISGLIRTIREKSVETYAITNNHFRGQAVVTAIELLAELEGKLPAVPPQVAQSYPHLLRRV